MMETSTSVNKNYTQPQQENLSSDDVDVHDSVFYDNIKSQLDSLVKNPSDGVISKILAYSRAR